MRYAIRMILLILSVFAVFHAEQSYAQTSNLQYTFPVYVVTGAPSISPDCRGVYVFDGYQVATNVMSVTTSSVWRSTDKAWVQYMEPQDMGVWYITAYSNRSVSNPGGALWVMMAVQSNPYNPLTGVDSIQRSVSGGAAGSPYNVSMTATVVVWQAPAVLAAQTNTSTAPYRSLYLDMQYSQLAQVVPAWKGEHFNLRLYVSAGGVRLRPDATDGAVWQYGPSNTTSWATNSTRVTGAADTTNGCYVFRFTPSNITTNGRFYFVASVTNAVTGRRQVVGRGTFAVEEGGL